MDPRIILPLAPESPWAAWARPDIKHCEANLAGWIAAPANTWSNLAYLAVGAWLIARSPKAPGRTLGWISVAVGLCSFAFHASYTAQGQLLDYAGMFLLTGWLLARIAVRAHWTTREGRSWGIVMGASLAAYAVLWTFHLPVQTIMILHVVVVVSLETQLVVENRVPLTAALVLIAAAYICWHMDHSDAYCRPEDHLFQWHAAWHVLTAAAFVPLAAYQNTLD